MIDPDSLAIGAILRAMAIKLARHEAGDDFEEALEALRESCEAAVARVPIPGIDPVESIEVRAQAQAVIGHLLEAPRRRAR